MIIKKKVPLLFLMITLGFGWPRLSGQEDLQEENQIPTMEDPTPTPTPVPVADVVASLKAEFIGASTCLACHADQEKFKHSVHGRSIPRQKGTDFEQSCETCHGPGSLHMQAAGDPSHPGFASLKVFKTMPAREVNASCLDCHKGSERMHWQGSAHENRNVSCVSCHSVHAPKSKKGNLTAVDEKTLCFQCHSNVKGEMRRNSHMPVMEGKMSCKDCHNPHGSATIKMLAADNVNQLCFNCHAEKRGPFLWNHAPVQENCTTCHVAHGAHNDKMLNARMPMLCQRCHMQSGHNNAAYNVNQLAQNRLINKSCVNCHSNIHGSNHPSGKYLVR